MLKWSEIFLSIEGEARYSGHPTLFVRLVGCNFTCRGFNRLDRVPRADVAGRRPAEGRHGAEPASGDEDALGFAPGDHDSLTSMPPIVAGCDSIYSWDPRFRHLWKEGTCAELATAIVAELPGRSWRHPRTGCEVLLCLTGGEPTLHAKTIPLLLEQAELGGVRRLLLETNCAVPLPRAFVEALSRWSRESQTPGRTPTRTVVWSNSPKLSHSGERWTAAIRPEIATSQREVCGSEQYFKFVCRDDESDFREVATAMAAYHEAGIPRDTDVYVMPAACTEDQQRAIAGAVAKRCLEHGFLYCHRIQNSVFENAPGT